MEIDINILETVAVVEAERVERKQIRDALGRSYGTGRRKNAIAKVWVKPAKTGKGTITVNKLDAAKYLARAVLLMKVERPLNDTKYLGNLDIICTVRGGGLSGQAGAISLGISRALVNFDPSTHSILRKGGYLTRDSRVVERKKYGQSGARKRFQFSKR